MHYAFNRWKCFHCGTVNLSSGAGGLPDGGDGHQGGEDDRPAESLNGLFILFDNSAVGRITVERLQCISDNQIGFKSDGCGVGEGEVMVTSL